MPGQTAISISEQKGDPPNITLLSTDLKRSVMRLARELRAQRTDQQVTVSQFAALSEIISVGSLTLRELSERERVSSPAMNRHVTALRKDGYIDSTRNEDDRRGVHFRATAKGIELFEGTHRQRDEWLSKELAKFSETERSLLHMSAQLLARIGQA